MELADLLSAASDGFFTLLDAAIGADQATVTTEMPQIGPKDTGELKFIVIGDIDTTSAGGKDEQLEELTVQVEVIYRGRQRSVLHSLMHQVRTALDGAVPAIAGVAFGSIDFAGAVSSRAARDGVTRAGILEFIVNAEPA